MTEPAPVIDPRLAAALAAQLRQWRTTLREGAERVGWKLGVGDRERIGHEMPDLDPDHPADASQAITGVGVALEIVDLTRPPDDPVSVVAANVFHRAVAFSPFQPTSPAARIQGRLIVNSRVEASAPVAADVIDRVGAVARLLGAMGEPLQAGDRIITGSVVQVAVKVGDQVIADMGPLGRVTLLIGP